VKDRYLQEHLTIYQEAVVWQLPNPKFLDPKVLNPKVLKLEGGHLLSPYGNKDSLLDRR